MEISPRLTRWVNREFPKGSAEEYPEARATAFALVFRELGLIRLAIGLESPGDLIADLSTA